MNVLNHALINMILFSISKIIKKFYLDGFSFSVGNSFLKGKQEKNRMKSEEVTVSSVAGNRTNDRMIV